MKVSFILFMFLSVLGFASDEINLEGTLFKKNGKWHLFVESENSSIKKGVFELVDIPQSEKKFLVEQAVVDIAGKRKTCDSKQICLAVNFIKPTVYDPLKGRKK